MFRRFSALTGVAVLALLLTAIVSAKTYVISASDFDSNGASISGWRWLRSGGNTATWTFNVDQLQAAKKNSVYVNFNPLVTNKASGGSGYEFSCKVTVDGAASRTFAVSLKNPYRPIDPEDSRGLGYQCYGHSVSSIPPALWEGASTIKVTVSYPFPQNYHLAVNREAMTLGYSK